MVSNNINEMCDMFTMSGAYEAGDFWGGGGGSGSGPNGDEHLIEN